MPLIGAISEASRSAMRAESSAASAAATCALALSSDDLEFSSAIGEMNLSLARPMLDSCVRWACARVVLTAARLAVRSATLVCSSLMSMRPSSSPALTRWPSWTLSASSVPVALERTMAVLGATSGPENSTTCGNATCNGLAASVAVKSSGTSLAAASGALAAIAALAGIAAAPLPALIAKPAPIATTIAATANTKRLRMSSSFIFFPGSS